MAADPRIDSADFPVGDADPTKKLVAVVRWYFDTVFGRFEGPAVLPFYCDEAKVGRFAVDPAQLAVGEEETLFRLFVGLAMFQARRDVLIMKQQRLMTGAEVASLSSVARLRSQIERSECRHLKGGADFEAGCSVRKLHGLVDCDEHPGAPCHVKDATRSFRRMSDMGKLPTSAWLRVGVHGWAHLYTQALRADPRPDVRAEILVRSVGQVHRVGVKLATMFVSALSVPALAPDRAPWFPEVDGSRLVVVDTHVARAIDLLAGPTASRTRVARVAWMRARAAEIDLGSFADVPSYSPRLVQQALYWFCSRSNRAARGDRCSVGRAASCSACVTELCPFVGNN